MKISAALLALLTVPTTGSAVVPKALQNDVVLETDATSLRGAIDPVGPAISDGTAKDDVNDLAPAVAHSLGYGLGSPDPESIHASSEADLATAAEESELLTEEEFLELLEDKSEEGIKKIITRFYGREMVRVFGRKPAKKIIGGMAGMLLSHITAPLSAWDGDGQGAVDDVLGSVGAIAGGILGGPVGAVVGTVISAAPGYIIDYFDTTEVQFTVSFMNVSPYHIRFSSYQTDYRKYWSIMKGYVPDEFGGQTLGHSPHKALYTYNGLKDYMIPKPITFRGEDKFYQAAYTAPLAVQSKWAQCSFQLEALDDEGNVVKTYDVAFKWPGGWWGEHHYVGIWENASWPRTDRNNYDAMETMGWQGDAGEHNRPPQGTSGESKAYWFGWNDGRIELH